MWWFLVLLLLLLLLLLPLLLLAFPVVLGRVRTMSAGAVAFIRAAKGNNSLAIRVYLHLCGPSDPHRRYRRLCCCFRRDVMVLDMVQTTTSASCRRS